MNCLIVRDSPPGNHSVSRLSCVYYFFLAIVVIRYETTATACRALLFVVRALFNDAIPIAIWTGFHLRTSSDAYAPTPSNIRDRHLIYLMSVLVHDGYKPA